MERRKLRVGVIGAGIIAEPYGRELMAEPDIEIVGIGDALTERAEVLAAKLGVPAFASVDALLADSSVDAVVNLTVQRAHAEVNTRILQMGKHAYSEKPLAMSYAGAQGLVALADRCGVRIACAPSTFMGEAQQTAWKLIREDRIGTVRVAYAEVNWGRMESWHPAPEAYYDTGVMPDVGIYPLSILTAIFGPARRVRAYGKVILPERVTKKGEAFQVTIPEFVIAVIELASGTVARLTANWYVDQRHTRQAGMEFHGDRGSIVLDSWLEADAAVYLAEPGAGLQPVPLVRPVQRGVVWSRAVPELARAIAEGRPHRASGEHAAHLVEIMDAVGTSISSGWPVEVTSSFVPPAPMEWA